MATIAAGTGEVPYSFTENKSPADHYTIIEIRDHNRRFAGRTLGKIKQFLRSMYREDFRSNSLQLQWQGSDLNWEEQELLVARNGTPYRKDFQFTVETKPVHGWVGILAHGSRADAGFSIIHCGRVVRGYPDAWRPESLYGQLQGSNDLVNQRLVGEIHLDAFDVSHTKDNILWLGDQEDVVQREMRRYCTDYRDTARDYRRSQDDERGPSEAETQVAVDELKKELESAEMVDAITVTTIPSEDLIKESDKKLAETITVREATVRARVGGLIVEGYLAFDVSPNDPYLVVDSADATKVIAIISQVHPHWSQLKGSDGVLNYLRHCIYDAIAEWQARQKVGRLDSSTIKLLKDKLLRISFDVEMTTADSERLDDDSDI